MLQWRMCCVMWPFLHAITTNETPVAFAPRYVKRASWPADTSVWRAGTGVLFLGNTTGAANED